MFLLITLKEVLHGPAIIALSVEGIEPHDFTDGGFAGRYLTDVFVH